MGMSLIPDQSKRFLSSATRQSWARQELLILAPDNWQGLVAKHSSTKLRERVELMLRYILEQTGSLGRSVEISGLDYPLFDMTDQRELNILIGHARKLKLLRTGGPVEGSDRVHRWKIALTVKGFEHLEPAIQIGGEPGRCFVAMSFSNELDPIYVEGIAAAIKDLNMVPVRMKELRHNEEITARLLAEIRRAEFVVADYTEHKGGVYYEAGFAAGLGRKVIMTCREGDDFAKLHFDTRNIQHIKWRDAAHLRQELRDQINATIIPKA